MMLAILQAMDERGGCTVADGGKQCARRSGLGLAWHGVCDWAFVGGMNADILACGWVLPAYGWVSEVPVGADGILQERAAGAAAGDSRWLGSWLLLITLRRRHIREE